MGKKKSTAAAPKKSRNRTSGIALFTKQFAAVTARLAKLAELAAKWAKADEDHDGIGIVKDKLTVACEAISEIRPEHLEDFTPPSPVRGKLEEGDVMVIAEERRALYSDVLPDPAAKLTVKVPSQGKLGAVVEDADGHRTRAPLSHLRRV